MQIRIQTLLALLLVAACGGDGDGGGGTSEIVEIVKWTPSGDNQTGIAGTQLPVSLRVKVTVNDVVSAGHTVTWSGPGVFGTPSGVTGANGIVTTTWTLPNGTGDVSATASLAGAVGSPVTFHATSSADDPAALNKIDGDNQAAEFGQNFPAGFRVQVVDQYGNGVDGITVSFQASGPVTLAAASVITTDGGYASGFLTAQNSVGAATLTATVVGLTGSPRTFSANVINTPVEVAVRSNYFDPDVLNITAGQAVKWVWYNSGHTVSSTSGPPIGNTPVQDAGLSYGPILFSDAGTYTYECSVHAIMTGSVVVAP